MLQEKNLNINKPVYTGHKPVTPVKLRISRNKTKQQKKKNGRRGSLITAMTVIITVITTQQ